MNARYRWLSVEPLGRAQLAKVAASMQARPYTRDGKSGYTLSTVRADLLEGAYTERVEYVERVSDPLGEEISVSRVEFRRTEFRLASSYPQLELRNAARQVKPILNLIADSLDFHVSVEPITISPLEWAKALANASEAIHVLAIRSTKFPLSNDVQAFVAITGMRDVRSVLPSLLGKRSVDAELVVCGWGGEGHEWRVELRSVGCANVITSPVDNPAQLLRKALAASKAR